MSQFLAAVPERRDKERMRKPRNKQKTAKYAQIIGDFSLFSVFRVLSSLSATQDYQVTW